MKKLIVSGNTAELVDLTQEELERQDSENAAWEEEKERTKEPSAEEKIAALQEELAKERADKERLRQQFETLATTMDFILLG